MCLAIPGKLTDIYEKDNLRMAKIDFGGIVKEVCLAYVPEAKIGEYALIHVGFAISLMDSMPCSRRRSNSCMDRAALFV
jgi:hydrogenase expression/formation protein HypC